MLGFEADRTVSAVMRATLAAGNVGRAGGIDLNAGLIGQRFHHAAALRVIQLCGAPHRFALAENEIVVVAARVGHLRAGACGVEAVAQPQAAAHIKRRTRHGHISARRNERFVADRRDRVRIDGENMIADRAAGAAREVEIGVIGHVAMRGLVGRRLIADGKVAVVIPAVCHGDVQRAGEMIFAVRTDVMQAEKVAVCGFNRVGRPKLFAQNTVEMVFAVVAIQLICRAVDGEASLRDAIAIAADRVAHAAVIGEIAFQIVKAQRNVIQHAVAIRHDDVGENRAIVDDAHRRAARIGQGELRDVMPVRRNAERFFRYSHRCRLLLQNKRLFFCTVSISAIQKSVNLYPENFGERTEDGLDSLRLLQVRFPVCKKKKLSTFAELFLWHWTE